MRKKPGARIKYDDKMIAAIKALHKAGFYYEEIGNMLTISRSVVARIVTSKKTPE